MINAPQSHTRAATETDAIIEINDLSVHFPVEEGTLKGH